MSSTFYSILHVISVVGLLAGTFYAFAAPAETRKKVLALTGIASLVALIAAFGLIAKVYQNHFAGWMIVKLVCWLGLSALGGIGYRRRGAVGVLAVVALLLASVAVVMVYTKPF